MDSPGLYQVWGLAKTFSMRPSIVALSRNISSARTEPRERINTFIVPLLEAAPQQPVREALLVFLHFQGEDGDIVDRL